MGVNWRSPIYIIGTNFKHTSLDRVARVQWPDKSLISPFLQHVRYHLGIEEIFFLQTCNRREFYIYAPDHRGEELKDALLAAVSKSIGCSLAPEDFYLYQDREVALHLFRVASSLDSMVLGETEIMKQIKDQSCAALRHGHLDRRIKALVDTAIWAAKQVRHKTEITKNVVSMASLAFRKVIDHVRTRATKRVVFVGAGHFITSLLPTFTKSNELELFFVNRTLPEALARQYGGVAMTLDEFLAQPVDFDAMISATGALETLFSMDWIAAHQKDRLLLDAALPRDIDPRVRTLSGIDYMDLDQMEAVLVENRAARAAEIPKTVPIFEEGWQRLDVRWLECDLAGINQQISKHYRDTGEKALSHLFREDMPNLSPREEELLRGWTRALVGKLTNIPILGLKGVARDVGTEAVDSYTRNVAANSRLFRT